MHRTLGRRLLGAAAAVTAAVAISSPAYAAAPQIVVQVPDATVAAGGHAGVVPYFFAEQDLKLPHAKVTFQLSDGLAGVALTSEPSARPYDACIPNSPTNVNCALPDGLEAGPYGAAGDIYVGLT